MDSIAKLSPKERSIIFVEVASKLSLPHPIVEKDFWVSWVLGKLFENQEIVQTLCFKGGTSLSKGFGIIERFSEDIDLILHQKLILKDGETMHQPSKTKQDSFNDKINERAQEYISTTLKNQIIEIISPSCSVKSDESDKYTLWINTPSQFKNQYIRPEIKLEIGPLALWNPNEQTLLTSFIGKALPELKLKEAKVPTIKPERTFWEKITILHLEHHRPTNSTIPERYSRHYYDVYKLAKSFVKENAYSQLELLQEVIEFKKRFYPRGWAGYEKAANGELCLLPAEHSQSILAKYYAQMQSMIYGDYPSWEAISSYLVKLETEINLKISNKFSSTDKEK